MAENSLGLLFEISADPTKAQAALGSLGPQVEQFGSRVTGSMAQPRESARLLSEVLGVHMPRAITSSIARMEEFQAVASTAFAVGAGVFAVEALVKYGVELKKTIEEAGGMVEIEREMKEAVKENEEAITDLAKSSHDAALQMVRALNNELVAEEAVAEAHRQALEAGVARFGVLAVLAQKFFGQTKEQNEFDLKVDETRHRLDAIIKIAGQDAVKAHEEAAKAALNEYNQLKILTGQWNAYEKQVDDALKRIVADSIAADKALNDEFFAKQAATQEVLKEFNNTIAQSATEMSNYPDYIQPASAALKDFGETLDLVTKALGIQEVADTESAKSMVANNLVRVGDSILGRQKMAVIEAVVETAKGFASLGDFDFWGAAQHFTAAATWGVVAGTGSGAKYGVGGQGALGGGGTRAAGPQIVSGLNLTALKEQALAPGTAGAQAPRPSGNVPVLIMGDASAAHWLAQTLNKGVLQNDLKLVSSHTKRAPYVTP